MNTGQTKNRALQHSSDKDVFFVLVPCLLLCIVIALVVMFTEYQPPEDQPCGSKVPEYTWSLQYPTDLRLYDIIALDANHVWAVGELGTILFYNGYEWTKEESGTDKDLVSVSGVQPSVVWAVGYASSPFSTPGEGVVLSYEDGVWVDKEWPKYNNGSVFEVAVGDETHVWLGGYVIWFWDGVNFNLQKNSIYYYDVLLALSPTRVWACGKTDPEFYDGNEWTTTYIRKITPRKKPREGGRPIQSITSLDEEHIWAVGYQGNIFFFDGNEWTYQNSGTEEDLIDVEAIDAEHVLLFSTQMRPAIGTSKAAT